MVRRLVAKNDLDDLISELYNEATANERAAKEDWLKLEWASVAAGIAKVEAGIEELEITEVPA